MSGRLQGPTRGTLPDSEDEEETVVVETEDEGIALALSLCEPGEHIVIHEAHCKVRDNGTGCNCESTTLVAGARA